MALPTNLITDAIPAQPNKQLGIILANNVNAYVKPLLMISRPLTPADKDKFKNHTPFPERDNVELLNGKPVLTTITLESEPYEIETFNEKTKVFEKAKINGTKLVLETVLVDVSMSKNIVTTQIDGLNGTIKEFISDGDYNVSIRGAIVNKRGTAYPKIEVQKLIAITKCPHSIKVTCDYLSLFSIHNLSIEAPTLPQKEGTTNTQLFELNCLSDLAIDVIKINKQ
jgi:Domain of unknown function (DUF6046)